MKTSYSKFGKNYRFYMGLSKRFQGFGFMWEEDIFDVLKSERHFTLELRLFWFRAWFDYNKLVIVKYELFADPLSIEERVKPDDWAKGSGGEFVIKN